MKILNKQNGFTLIEVVCSVLILGLIVFSFSQFFVNSTKAVTYNNEKLVTINLADAALAKVQAIPFTKNNTISNVNQYFVAANGVPQTILMNEKLYKVTYEAEQSNASHYTGGASEKELNLVRVVVTVEAPDGTKKSSSEGYVKIE